MGQDGVSSAASEFTARSDRYSDLRYLYEEELGVICFQPADGASSRGTCIYIQGNRGPVIGVHYVHPICGW